MLSICKCQYIYASDESFSEEKTQTVWSIGGITLRYFFIFLIAEAVPIDDKSTNGAYSQNGFTRFTTVNSNHYVDLKQQLFTIKLSKVIILVAD